jgi:hypothetical protein
VLAPDLQDPRRLLHGVHEGGALVDRVGQRFLAVDVLAGIERVETRTHVPVIGRGDDDGVDVLAVEDAAVVACAQRAIAEQLPGALEVAVVTRCGGDDLHVGHAQRRVGVGEPLRAEPDHPQADRVVGTLRDGVHERSARRPGSGARGREQESTTIDGVRRRHRASLHER